MAVCHLRAVAAASAILAVAAIAHGNQFPAFQATQVGSSSTFTYSGLWTDGEGDDHQMAAKVVFAIDSNSNLTVTLTNTYTGDVRYQVELLNAVFFDAAPGTLTPLSAIVPAGSTVLFPGAADPKNPHGPLPPGDVGGEFAFRSGLVGTPGNAGHGVSSVGIELFGKNDLFPPQIDLDKPESPNGSNYGITSAGDDPNTGQNPDVTGQEPLIKNEVVFTLSGLPAGVNFLSTVNNVWFLYGTSWQSGPPDVGQPPIPEPLTLAGVAAGLGMMGSYLRGRTRRP